MSPRRTMSYFLLLISFRPSFEGDLRRDCRRETGHGRAHSAVIRGEVGVDRIDQGDQDSYLYPEMRKEEIQHEHPGKVHEPVDRAPEMNLVLNMGIGFEPLDNVLEPSVPDGRPHRGEMSQVIVRVNQVADVIAQGSYLGLSPGCCRAILGLVRAARIAACWAFDAAAPSRADFC